MRPPRHLLIATLALGALVACEPGTDPAPQPAAIQLVSGDGQFTLTQDPLPEPLVVRVVDDAGAPIAGVQVTWNTAQGQFNSSQTTTDSDGLTSAEWTLASPGTPLSSYGVKTATATVLGGTPSVSFSASLLHGPDLRSFSFTPDSGDTGSGPLNVAISVETYTMYLGIRTVRMRFRRAGTLEDIVAVLTRSAGTAMDGTWTGTLEIPQGTAAGVWEAQVYVATLSEDDCGCDGYPRANFNLARVLRLTSN